MNKDRIKKIRITLSLTQSQLAELLSVSERTIQQWEAGNRNPNGSSTIKLLELEKKKSIYECYE